MATVRNARIRSRPDRPQRWKVSGVTPSRLMANQSKFSAAWTEEDARVRAGQAHSGQGHGDPPDDALGPSSSISPGERKRSLAEDRRMLKHLVARFGADARLPTLTSEVISQYRDERLSQPSVRRGNVTGLLSPCTVNRELALLSHLLRLSHDEWNALAGCRGSAGSRNRKAGCAGSTRMKRRACSRRAAGAAIPSSMPSPSWPWRPACGRARSSG